MAGVVISDQDLTNYIPLKHGDEIPLTQYDAHGVEASGLFEDGLSGTAKFWTLSERCKICFAKIEDIYLKIEEIDLSNRQAYLLPAIKCIFQFEQLGAIRLLKRVHLVRFGRCRESDYLKSARCQ